MPRSFPSFCVKLPGSDGEDRRGEGGRMGFSPNTTALFPGARKGDLDLDGEGDRGGGRAVVGNS